MEKDVVEMIETTSPANNERKEEIIVSVRLVDEEERFQNEYRENQLQSDFDKY